MVCGFPAAIRVMNGPFARASRARVRVMTRPFPTFAVALTAAVLVAAVSAVTAESHWLGDNLVIVGVALLAVGVCLFNWWELWSNR